MENNGDDLLRQKLNSIEPAFDAQAWQQMEAMLERKKKRRGLIWWWFSGAAAGMLLLVGVASYWQQKNKTPNERELTAVSKRSSVDEYSDKNKTAEKKVNNTATTNQTESANALQSKQTIPTEQKIAAKRISNHKRNEAAKSSTASTQKSSIASAVNATIKQKEDQVAGLTIPTPRLLTAHAELLYASLLKSSTEELTTLTASDEEVMVPRKKKPIVQYSAGVSGGISFSTMQHVDPTSDYRQQAFTHKTPSWSVGFTNDILFVNRVAISTGIMYAQTSFTISPILDNYPTGVSAYRSDIKELHIPVGVKVYPYRNQKVGVYINTGFLNHIKLRENFSYQAIQPSLATGVQDVTNGLPTFNDFSSTGIESATNNPALFNAGIDRFSIARGNRYYASYYVHAGVEAIFRKRIIVFAEPSFTLSLATAQEMRKYNVGMVTGFRFNLH